MFNKIIFRRIFIISLPVLFAILANLASNAHLKTFCIIKFLIHHPCAGCGLTRAFAALSRFQFREAYELNPFVFVVLLFLVFAWIMILKNEFSNNKKGTV